MIISIGCDIVEHELTRKLNWENSASIQNRIFSVLELDIYASDKKITFLTGRFAAKEAVLKCLGKGMEDGIDLTDIHILRSELGTPIVTLTGNVQALSIARGIKKWHVSITHSNNTSSAFVIAEGN